MTERLFVNSGTSEYGTSSLRDFERSTAAHSTLELNRESSSEVWGGFRVGRRARVSVLKLEDCEERCELIASHDGYRYLHGRPVHERRIMLSHNSLEVCDRITECNYFAVAVSHSSGVQVHLNHGGLSGNLFFK